MMVLPHIHIKNNKQFSIGIEGKRNRAVTLHLLLFNITVFFSESFDTEKDDHYSFEILPLKLGFTCFYKEVIIAFSLIDFLFGYTDWYFIPKYELKQLETNVKWRCVASKGMLYKCPGRLFPILKRLPGFGKIGYELKTYNRIMDSDITFYTYSFNEVEQKVNESNTMSGDDYMRK